MDELPKIISVDDHVVEPPHVWQAWLPQKYREKGPRVERKRWGDFKHLPGAKYEMVEDPGGLWGDAWHYEDRLIYVHKRFVAIPQEAVTPGVDGGVDFDRTKMVMKAVTYDEMLPGCYDRDARIADFELNWMDGSLPFPTFPRFCGQTFYEGDDKELGLACVRAYNDWMVEEWCGPSGGVNIPLCLIPLWDVELAAEETERNAKRGVRAICFSELPHHLKLPTTYYHGRIFGCFTADHHGLHNLDAVGRDNICFEVDYPHTDTTWPYSKAYVEKITAHLDDQMTYKVLRGNAIKMLELDRV